MTERLTDRAITAKKPADRAVLIFDTEVTGLAVKVHPSGFKSFVFIWHEHGRQRRTTLGRFPTWTVGKARTHAGRMRLKADVGETVTPGRSGKVSDLIETWKETVRLTRRPSTVKSYLRLIDRRIVPEFGKSEPRAITRNGVELWHGRIAKTRPIEANRALAVLSSFLSWLEHDKKIDDNPCHGVQRRPENQRQVFLTAEQIAEAHTELMAEKEEWSAALALRMALLTGARIGEVLNLHDTASGHTIDVTHKVWIKPAASTKQKKLHIVPLQAEALAVASQLLQLNQMPTYDQCRVLWLRVRKVIGREDIRIHDLRHSRASSLARQKASLPQIGRVLGHTSPQTTQRYAHLVATDLREVVEAAD